MALPIIPAVRNLPFKQSVKDTLEELAHRASIYGVVRVSATYMGRKCHHHPRTFQRHMVKAVEARVVRKTVTKTVVEVRVGHRVEKRLWNEINTYTFILPWKQFCRTTPPNGKMPCNLPPPEREKERSVREELDNQKKMLRFGLYTPGSDLWKKTEEEITRLEALLVQRE